MTITSAQKSENNNTEINITRLETSPTCSTLLSISSSSSASRSARPPPAPLWGPPCCSSWRKMSKMRKRQRSGKGSRIWGFWRSRAPLWLSSAALWQCQALESADQVAFAHWQWQEDPTAQKWLIKIKITIFNFKSIDFYKFTLRTLSSSVSTNCSTDISYWKQSCLNNNWKKFLNVKVM